MYRYVRATCPTRLINMIYRIHSQEQIGPVCILHSDACAFSHRAQVLIRRTDLNLSKVMVISRFDSYTTLLKVLPPAERSAPHQNPM